MRTAGTRLASLVLTVAIGAVLVTDAAVVGLRQGDRHEHETVSVDAPGVKGRPLEKALPELVAFVEQSRGLKFLRPPKVELLADDKFEAKLNEGDTSAPEEEAAFVGLFRALGLVTGDIDLKAVAEDTTSNIVGFYDPQTKVLYARGAEPTPYVKSVLVHELTHALDDQHFGLDRPELYDDDEAAPAFDALIEGSAMVVEERWYDSRPRVEQEAIDAEEGGAGGDPDVFTELFAFPYQVGPRLVHALLDAGGQARLDEAFRHPPVSTEQAIHPERFLAGEAVKSVASPAADGEIIDEGTLGELGLVLLFDSVTSRTVALKAAAGWGGDHYVAWTSRGKTCVRFTVVMDTAQDTTELVSALRSWTANNPSATVRGSGPLTVTNCA